MPHLPELEQGNLQVVTASVGGSVLHPHEQFNVPFVRDLMDFTLKLTQEGKIVILVTGGGSTARVAQRDARELGVEHQPSLDQLGVYITTLNALWLERVFEASGIHTHTLHRGDMLHEGIVYLRGGSEPGHTTDFVTIQHAIEAGQKIVLNISTAPGLHPVENNKLIENQVIPEITWEDYIRKFSVDHAPGVNTPFDKPASLLAKEHGITAILIGPDFENIRNLLDGKEFVGTVLHP